jgi:hypothetical protein
MTEPIVQTSLRLQARTVGALYFVAVLAAVSGESLLRGRWALRAGFIAVACFVVLTLLLYGILKPVNKGLALLAACSGLVGLTFEALRWNPRGVDFGVVFHGFYCLLTGYLVFRSNYLPHILGMLMALAGLSWLTFLWPSLANHLSPYNVSTAFLGEGPLMLWLLVIGVNVPKRGVSRP